jgi:rod shape-determining protein MreB
MPLRSLGRLLGYALALDPGSRSVKALAAGGRVAEVPSLVARVDPGRAALLGAEPVGEEARALSYSRRPGVTIIRPIERGVIADVGAAEKLFAHVFALMLEEAPGRVWTSRPRVICGIGAGLTEVEQRAFADVLDRAGARSVDLVPSLAACACALDRQAAEDARKEEGMEPQIDADRRGYGRGRGEDEIRIGVHPRSPPPGGQDLRFTRLRRVPSGVHLVAELGHGRTGVGLASVSGVLASRHVPLGARDLDLALSGYLRRRGLVVSVEDAARLRETLGLPASHPSREDGPPRSDRLKDVEDCLPRHVGAALAPFLELLVDSVREVIAAAPGDVVEDLLDEGLVLAGAPAATPGLAGAIGTDLELPARVAPEPAGLRVRGLALLAEDEQLLGEVGVRV